MRIGFTYDLADDYLKMGFSPEDTAEFDTAVTIEGIESALAALGFQVEKIGNIKALTVRLAEFYREQKSSNTKTMGLYSILLKAYRFRP